MTATIISPRVTEAMEAEFSLRCRNSYHPFHMPCGAPAVYIVSFDDADHEGVEVHAPMCPEHVFGYWSCALYRGWCECPHPHKGCRAVNLRIDRVR